MGRRDPAAAARAAMPERYGPQRRSLPLPMLASVVALALVGVGWLLWAAWSASTPEVSGGVVGYRVVSDGRTEVTLEVRRRETTAVTCKLYAQDRSAAVVGEELLDLPTDGAGTVTVTAQVATTRRAASASLESCQPG